MFLLFSPQGGAVKLPKKFTNGCFLHINCLLQVIVDFFLRLTSVLPFCRTRAFFLVALREESPRCWVSYEHWVQNILLHVYIDDSVRVVCFPCNWCICGVAIKTCFLLTNISLNYETRCDQLYAWVNLLGKYCVQNRNLGSFPKLNHTVIYFQLLSCLFHLIPSKSFKFILGTVACHSCYLLVQGSPSCQDFLAGIDWPYQALPKVVMPLSPRKQGNATLHVP